MFKIEIFDQLINPVDYAFIPETTEIVEDYETLEQYVINIPREMSGVTAWDIFRIVDDNNNVITNGVIMSVSYENKTTALHCCCILALLDFETANPKQTPGATGYDAGPINITDTTTWLANACDIHWTDDLHTSPARYVFGFGGSVVGKVTKFNDMRVSCNVFDVWKEGRKQEKMTFNRKFTGFNFDYNQFNMTCGVTNSVIYIDADALNVMEKTVNVSSQNGAANCCVVHLYKIENDIISGVETRYYYRHPDGSVDMSTDDIIRPIVYAFIDVQKDLAKSDAQNYAICLERATEELTDAETKNEITLTFSADDQLIPPSTFDNANAVTIKTRGVEYESIFTGLKRTGKRITYFFGSARTSLTAQLAQERRNKR